MHEKTIIYQFEDGIRTMELKSWIFCRYGSPTAINHPKTSPNIDKSTFNALTAIRLIPPVWISHNFKATTLSMTRKTMRNKV